LLVIDPTVWLFERFAMGICTAVLMVVCESWLNDMSGNTVRGKVLALYTIISWGTPMIGVWMLRFVSSESAFFFILASICISVAVVPMLLSVSKTPRFLDAQRLPLRALYKRTPLGVIGALLSGACHGAFFATVAIFGTVSAYSVAEISTLITIALGGGVIAQWPIALLSDRFDRRLILAIVAGLGALSGLYFTLAETETIFDAYVAVFVLSACILSLYSQCIAHTNDNIDVTEVVPAASTLILLYGLGFAAAPAIIAPLLDLSPSYFFLSNAVLMTVLTAVVIVRMVRREAVGDQGNMIAMPTSSPYASVVTAAEEWAPNPDDRTTVSIDADPSQTDRGSNP
ncbi:MAG: MFS transporter, partial [Pseudomonadota bacterium]